MRPRDMSGSSTTSVTSDNPNLSRSQARAIPTPHLVQPTFFYDPPLFEFSKTETETAPFKLETHSAYLPRTPPVKLTISPPPSTDNLPPSPSFLNPQQKIRSKSFNLHGNHALKTNRVIIPRGASSFTVTIISDSEGQNAHLLPQNFISPPSPHQMTSAFPSELSEEENKGGFFQDAESPTLSEISPIGLLPQRSQMNHILEEHYKDLLKNLAYHLVLMLLVAPIAMNAFCEPSRVNPADINEEWWNSLSANIKFLSVMNGFFSMSINVFVQRDYIPQALNELRMGLSKCFNSPYDFLANFATLISSGAAAFSFGAISQGASTWMGKKGAFIPGMASFGTSFATRYPSVKKAPHKILGIFKKERRFQKELAEQLRHLRPQYEREFNQLIETRQYKLKNQDIIELLMLFNEKFENKPRAEIFYPSSSWSPLKNQLILFLDLSFATLIASTAFLTFTQKGFDGANAIAHFSHRDLNNLAMLDQFAIGAVGGAVSAMLYANSGLNFMPTLRYVSSELFWDLASASRRFTSNPIQTLKETTEDPQRFFRFLKLSLALLFVWRSSSSMVTVGNGVVRNKKGIFSPLFQFWVPYGTAFPTLNGLGCMAIHLTSTINQLLKGEKEKKIKNPQLGDVASHLEEELLPSSTSVQNQRGESFKISTFAYLRFSLFQAPSSDRPSSMEGRDHSARDVDSGEEDDQLPLLDKRQDEEKPPRTSCCQKVQRWFKCG